MGLQCIIVVKKNQRMELTLKISNECGSHVCMQIAVGREHNNNKMYTERRKKSDFYVLKKNQVLSSL